MLFTRSSPVLESSWLFFTLAPRTWNIDKLNLPGVFWNTEILVFLHNSGRKNIWHASRLHVYALCMVLNALSLHMFMQSLHTHNHTTRYSYSTCSFTQLYHVYAWFHTRMFACITITNLMLSSTPTCSCPVTTPACLCIGLYQHIYTCLHIHVCTHNYTHC